MMQPQLELKVSQPKQKVLKNAYGYIRVSTTKQAEEGVSIEMQQKKLEKWCKKNKRNLVRVTIDAGISGTLPIEERPGLLEIINSLMMGDIFVVYELSRMGRNYFESMKILQKIQEKGAHFASVVEGYDTTTPMGVTMMQLMSAIAEMQAKQIARNAKETAITFKESGRHTGPVPYGYRLRDPSIAGSGLVEQPEEQEVIRMIKEMRNTPNKRGRKTSFYDIAAELNKMGIPSPGGKLWSPPTITGIYRRKNVGTKGRADVGLPTVPKEEVDEE